MKINTHTYTHTITGLKREEEKKHTGLTKKYRKKRYTAFNLD
jgi:hypothetical protein